MFPFSSFSVLPFSLNTTFPEFILSPVVSNTSALSVIVSPDFAVIVSLSSVMFAVPGVICSASVDYVLDDV